MKRPLQLSLAIALALGATETFALGLGVIRVQSGLNQPLKAEIPVIQSVPGEAEGLIVQLASEEDFERVGMSRSKLTVPVQFSVGKDAQGQPVIRVTSTEAVTEPFVGLLLEANWPKGRLLREYTVLLDPPVMAPAVKGASAVAMPASEPARTEAKPLPPSKPAAESKPAPVAAAKPAPSKPAPAKPAATPARAVSGNEYGPVAAGETLGEIARATLPNDSVSINQMMLALLKSNPNAFYKDNINALKRGAVLRIPTAEEVASSASARDAAATVRAQIDEWRGASSSAPTLVADTTPEANSGTSRPNTSSSTDLERLALVPPREGKADQGAADRPGSGSGDGGAAAAAAKAELARTREALTSKEQEVTELNSRVGDLEEIRDKNEKLINLQNTELAELRARLKQLEADAAKAASAKATPAEPATAATVTATTPPPPADSGKATQPSVSKDDIWGDADKSAIVATPDAADKDAAEPAAASATDKDTTPAAGPATDAAASTPSASVTPATETSATTPAVAPKPEQAKPAAKPAEKKPETTPPKAPAIPAKPWYQETWVLIAAAVGGLLLVGLGLLGLRKRKPVPAAPRASIASTFGDSPIGLAPTEVVAHSAETEAEEQELIAQVQADPGNPESHLQLLSLYYAQGDTGKFEAAAEDMYAYVADPNQPAWREVRRMGEELVPHNPLFSNADALAGSEADLDAGSTFDFGGDEPETEHTPSAFDDFGSDAPAHDYDERSNASLQTATMQATDFTKFDVGEVRTPPAQEAYVPPADTSFSFDDLPPLEAEPPAPAPAPAMDIDESPVTREVPAAAELSDEEFFSGDDAVGTKLDLAKAYLDMGDPEGARSMLEEVLAEGAPAQQEEARKLIAELG